MEKKMLLLNVSYTEKDQAKKLGARWNPTLKKWYVEKKQDYYKFKDWFLPPEECPFIICDFIYIVVAQSKCFMRKKETPVIGFAVQNYFYIYPDPDSDPPVDYYYDHILITDEITDMPEYLCDNLKKRFNYFYDNYNYVNHCKYCKQKQEAFYLYDNDNSPFFVNKDNVNNLENLVFYKVPLEIDFFCNFNYFDFSIKPLVFKEKAKKHVLLFESIT